MIETYNPEIISQHLNGAASEGVPMMKLMMQVIVILIVGIVLWRISAIFGRKKKNRHQNMFSESRYQKHWRRK